MSRNRWKKIISCMLACCLAGTLLGCTPGASEPEQPKLVLTIGTADSGGTMYPVGSAIAEVLNSDDVKVNLSASTGSAMNARNLISGEVDLGLVSGDTALDAYQNPEGTGQGLRAIGAVFISQSNWLAPEDKGLVYVHDLGGKRLGVGPENSNTEISAMSSMKATGICKEETTVHNCSLVAGEDMVLEDELDAIHGFAGTPIGALSHLADATPCRILKYTQEELDRILNEYGSVFIPVVLPAGTYRGQDEDVDTFGVKCLLCVKDTTDEDLVYYLAQKLWEGRSELAEIHPSTGMMEDKEFIFEDLTIPLHPGAQRFYDSIR